MFFSFLVFSLVGFSYSAAHQIVNPDLNYLGGSYFSNISNSLIVNQALANQCSQVWITNPISFASHFNVSFVFQFQNGSNSCVLDPQESPFCDGRSANGFSIVFQSDPAGSNATGKCGSSLGYAGIKNAV